MKYDRLQNALGYRFRNARLLEQALTHRSHSTPHNERLEFLGDGVLNCIVAAELYTRFETLREGELSRLRASLVREQRLHELASDLTLGDHLRLGEGELKSGGFRRPSILADALEAVIGAAYVDGGFDAACRTVTRLYGPLLDTLDVKGADKDPKTQLQEWLQSRRHALPEYSVHRHARRRSRAAVRRRVRRSRARRPHDRYGNEPPSRGAGGGAGGF